MPKVADLFRSNILLIRMTQQNEIELLWAIGLNRFWNIWYIIFDGRSFCNVFQANPPIIYLKYSQYYKGLFGHVSVENLNNSGLQSQSTNVRCCTLWRVFIFGIIVNTRSLPSPFPLFFLPLPSIGVFMLKSVKKKLKRNIFTMSAV